jgi:hypothetical protein
MLLTHTLSVPESNTTDSSAQNENQISDAEVFHRVLHIRSGWSLAERIQRRREAERRFADLVSRLGEI